MVQHVNSQKLTCRFQTSRHGDIFWTWRRVARWMVMDQDDGRSRILDCRAEYFAWMHKTGVEGADSYLVRIDNLILGIQCDDVKFFLF